MHISFAPFILQFAQPVRTSRGIMADKLSYIVIVRKGEKLGFGECSILKGLSPDNLKKYDDFLEAIRRDPGLFYEDYKENNLARLERMPSIRFGLEMAFKDLETQKDFDYFDSAFSLGVSPLAINGLIWMGEKKIIYDQIEAKLDEGWRCIKMKIGNNKFSEEIEILKYIRTQFGPDDVELRLDANGAFKPQESLEKLNQLSAYDIHSIEQPIQQGQWEYMADLCLASPIDIALDEELIGVYGEKQEQLLQIIRPKYIICKPSLLGGWYASKTWIDTANKYNIDWWATSALESNIGLNAIAQWAAQMDVVMPQGLGTGGLYINNIQSPMYISPGFLHVNHDANWGDIRKWLTTNL